MIKPLSFIAISILSATVGGAVTALFVGEKQAKQKEELEELRKALLETKEEMTNTQTEVRGKTEQFEQLLGVQMDRIGKTEEAVEDFKQTTERRVSHLQARIVSTENTLGRLAKTTNANVSSVRSQYVELERTVGTLTTDIQEGKKLLEHRLSKGLGASDELASNNVNTRDQMKTSVHIDDEEPAWNIADDDSEVIVKSYVIHRTKNVYNIDEIEPTVAVTGQALPAPSRSGTKEPFTPEHARPLIPREEVGHGGAPKSNAVLGRRRGKWRGRGSRNVDDHNHFGGGSLTHNENSSQRSLYSTAHHSHAAAQRNDEPWRRGGRGRFNRS